MVNTKTAMAWTPGRYQVKISHPRSAEVEQCHAVPLRRLITNRGHHLLSNPGCEVTTVERGVLRGWNDRGAATDGVGLRLSTLTLANRTTQPKAPHDLRMTRDGRHLIWRSGQRPMRWPSARSASLQLVHHNERWWLVPEPILATSMSPILTDFSFNDCVIHVDGLWHVVANPPKSY